MLGGRKSIAYRVLDSRLTLSQQLAGYQQQDAHEYMQFILNSLHTSSLSTATSSEHDRDCDCIIHRTFYGKYSSTVTCDECKNKTNTSEPFMDLSLDLRIQSKKRKLNGTAKTNGVNGKEDEGLRLEECLARFTSDERLGQDDYKCHKCGKQRDATKQLSIKQLPPVLSIHLKVGLSAAIEGRREMLIKHNSASPMPKKRPRNWKQQLPTL